ncbi:HPr family phosphocarrier protein [Cohnella fermenti]|uniref:HPr family phosphocarrier protein n=1 Tax=Cohnella fermenti TaxID=2565925 RepID=A0A4S4BKI6_9BACL|nr:HPr family phosphocarrier protein [Cohnella fermenti]THF75240.1 HPr family phosphocarrier protein [Cohnella fermenti]
MIRSIRIKDVGSIEKVNAIVSRYPFDIWIHSKSGLADAKSILGLYALKLNEPMFLVVPDGTDSKRLFEELEPYVELG